MNKFTIKRTDDGLWAVYYGSRIAGYFKSHRAARHFIIEGSLRAAAAA